MEPGESYWERSHWSLRMPLTTSRRARTPLQAAKINFLAFLAVLGPGFITANVDNDPGGILTYSQAGAKFGYALLWTLIPTTVALVVVQEMAARMGAATGKGLADLIREEFGLRATFFTMAVLGLADLGNIMAEFAGLASGTGIFGISKYLAVPLGAVLVWLLIVRGRYGPVEKLLVVFSLLYLAYPVSAFLAHPDWRASVRDTVVPEFEETSEYLVMVIGIVGTTITPWMQFYLQASIVEKGIDRARYWLSRWDVIFGCVFTDAVAFFIIVAAAKMIYDASGGPVMIRNAEEAAAALRPVAHGYAAALFAIGLFGASLLAAAVLPLSTAYTYSEAFGWEKTISRRFSEAPIFYSIFTFSIVFGSAVVLLPNVRLVNAMINAQAISGILLPVILVFMLKLINREDVMGEYTNSRIYNTVVWAMAIALIVMTVGWLVGLLLGF